MSKSGFHQLHSLKEALEILYSISTPVQETELSLDQALNKICSRDINAPIAVPSFSKSAMDGYAVLSSDTYYASPTRPIALELIGEILPGEDTKQVISTGQCIEIATGAKVPEGADGIVMVEHTEKEGTQVKVFSSTAPGHHIIQAGSDISKNQLVVKKGTRLTARHTSLLSGLGMEKIHCFQGLVVAVASTGNEIVRPPNPLASAQSYDINARALIDSIREYGCVAKDFGVIVDEAKEIEKTILEMVKQADIVVISGGSSLGTKDLILEQINKIGQVLVHGIAVKPGKPTLIGKIQDKLILGLPGHPASALSNFFILIKPYLDFLFQVHTSITPFIDARLTCKIASTIGRFEFIPVQVQECDSEFLALPQLKGSSAISPMMNSDGYIKINENIEVLDKNTLVRVFLF